MQKTDQKRNVSAKVSLCELCRLTWDDNFCRCINPLPNHKILDLSKLKAFADDKINVTEKLKFLLGRVENIARKGDNAGYQHCLLFPQCFQKATLSGSLKVGIVW